MVTGPYGYLVARVLHKKAIYKDYVGLDACMANLMRPGMYGAYHHITVPGKENGPRKVYDVTGSLCENNDKFAVDREIPDPAIGDLLVIHDTGAHGHAMGFNYNGKLRSAELLWQGGVRFKRDPPRRDPGGPFCHAGLSRPARPGLGAPMYIPPANRMEDRAAIRAFIRAYNFATVITHPPGAGAWASHLPLCCGRARGATVWSGTWRGRTSNGGTGPPPPRCSAFFTGLTPTSARPGTRPRWRSRPGTTLRSTSTAGPGSRPIRAFCARSSRTRR